MIAAVDARLPPPPRVGPPGTRRRPRTLHVALAVSLAVHAAVLTLRFVDPERFDRVFRDPPLEVVLVNARGGEAPDEAQAIAQASLAGGGDRNAGQATSPLPASPSAEAGDAAVQTVPRAQAPPPEPAAQLLARIQRDLATLPAPDPSEASARADETDTVEHRRRLLDQLARIERRINDDNARPKKRFVSPATREAVYALYYDHLRRRIEDHGTRDFPSAGGRKLYGELTVNMTIDARGRLLDARVLVPSALPQLDRQALAIVRAAAPFGAFGAAMRRESDQIVVTSRFRFTHGDNVEASIGATPR